jgi:PhzF family phenazine biosynthesis protein
MQVDAFATELYRGNPAAVCWLDEPRDPAWMQAVAREMNLSETAFVSARADGFDLRWFTPTTEVDLCGHATVASAHALWQWEKLAPSAAARFLTRSGWLVAERKDGWIVVDFPLRGCEPAPPPAGLIEALRVKPVFSGTGPGPVGPNVLLELDTEAEVRAAHPDFGALARLPVRSVTITAAGDSGGEYDFVSRFFAPAVGVDEDPVTGSAHCQLAGYWSRRLGKNQFLAYQASARGGVLRVELAGGRVRLGGQAVTVFRTDLED